MPDELIWTKKGNLPIASLAYETAWDVRDAYIKFTERYYDAGEIVRESVHVYDKLGMAGDAAPGGF